MRTALGRAVIMLNEMECHALYAAYCTHKEIFRTAFNILDDPELAKCLGEELKYARGTEFPATLVWKKLYGTLATIGLMGFCHLNDGAALPCQHTAEEHEAALRSVKAKLIFSTN